MDNIGLLSYAIGGAFFLILSVLLLVKWRGSREATLLVIATLITTGWAVSLAFTSLQESPSFLVIILEMGKYGVWLLFLLVILLKNGNGIPHYFIWIIIFTWLSVLIISLFATVPFFDLTLEINKFYIITSLGFSLLGLVLVEQLYRNTPQHNKWAIKFLCLGIGGIFVFDIYLYSNALLFKQIDPVLWDSRGIAIALIAPLIAIAAARNPDWSIVPFVSRHFIFYSTSLFAAGIYMFLMAVSGYYIKIYGESWGPVLQVIFSSGAILLLIVIMMSGQARARLKQFISINFYSNKYDYREEWLRLTRILSSANDGLSIYQRVLKGIAQIVDSPAGALWVKDTNEKYCPVAAWNISTMNKNVSPNDSNFLNYLEVHRNVINIHEYQKHSDHYEYLVLPDWVMSIPKAWLIVPIMHEESLYGFIVLTETRAALHHSWEDNELLRTVGQQVASYLAEHEAAKMLAEARQFEAFNRLSAFIVHDLKNVIAQLDLIVKNSQRHKNDPEFMQDAITTVDNAVTKMNRMLAQLRQDRLEAGNPRLVSINDVLNNVIKKRAAFAPEPKLKINSDTMFVIANEDHLASIVEHLVQNAQEATTDEGYIDVSLNKIDQWAVIEIRDTGCGMDADFIQNRLFKPFDTTKGNAGMGMGAYESRQIVRNLGGEMSVKSKVGEGTIITIRLPLGKKE